MLKLNHAQLAIPPGGEAQAKQFYGELASRGGLWFQAGNTEIHLGVEQEFRPAKKALVAFTSSDYALLLDSLLFKGAEHCYIADPFGNRIELINGSLP